MSGRSRSTAGTGKRKTPVTVRGVKAAPRDTTAAGLRSEVADLRRRLDAQAAELQVRTTERDEARAQQTATAEVLGVINSSPGNLAPVFEAILAHAMRQCGAVFGELRTYDGERFQLAATKGVPEAYAAHYASHTGVFSRGLGPSRLLTGERLVHVPDLVDTEIYRSGDPDRRALVDLGGARASLMVPLRKEAAVLGYIMVYRAEPGPFTDRQIELLQSFAAQAVIAMENARLLTETRESLERQTATAEILGVISASPSDAQPTFDAIARSAVRLCDADFSAVARLEPDGLLHLAATSNVSGTELEPVRAVFPRPPRPTFVMGRAVLQRMPVQVADVLAESDYDEDVRRAAMASVGYRTLLAVPILRGGEPIGAINLARRRIGPFTERQIELVRMFADQAVIAIENVRLFNETREALERQTATAEVLGVINSSPGDLVPVFEAILEKAHSLCAVAHGSLQLYDGETFRAVAVHNLPPALAGRLRQGYTVSDNPQSAGLVQGKSFVQADNRELTTPLARLAAEGGIRTVLRVALRKDDRLLGQIVASRQEVRPFTDKEIALLQSFAAQAVIAMENARLITETREALERQTATAEILRVISSSPTDVQPVMQAVVAAARRFCGAADAWIILRDGEELVRAAHEGPLPAGPAGSRLALDRSTVMGRAMIDERTVHVPDVMALDPAEFRGAIELSRSMGLRAGLAAPLLREGSAIGCVLLRRPEPGPFTPRQIELLETFAAQAVIAIENVRLMTETREALEQQTATAEVLGVINSSPGELQPVFEAMLERAMRLCGAAFGLLSTYDGERYHNVATLGVPPAWVAYRRRQKSAPYGPDTLPARLLAGESVIHVADLKAEAAYASGDPNRRALVDLGGARTALMVALQHEGAVRGFIQIYRQEVRPFSDRQVALLQNFAAQAVIAMENARLITETRAARDAAEAALSELKTAQASLIQAEKMASLGQLTAGIAHEIKNPLNFVTNFAGLSVDLLDELKQATAPALAALAGDQRAEVDDTMALLSGNLQKIAEHGRRADNIVRGMLEHSRGVTGERRRVDLNQLVDEALNLAYHGARAQDQGFNIALERDLAPALAEIELAPQEMTRVFLNMFGNGFYAARKRQRDPAEADFRPVLTVATRDLGNAVEVRIRDNGIGVAPEIKDKLFQPFFTTKPTGEGTGLGLSISYDIVVQQHGGSIEINSRVGEFTEFTIRLPRR